MKIFLFIVFFAIPMVSYSQVYQGPEAYIEDLEYQDPEYQEPPYQESPDSEVEYEEYVEESFTTPPSNEANLESRIQALENYLLDLQSYLETQDAEKRQRLAEERQKEEEAFKKEQERDNVDLLLKGHISHYYKLQTNYKTPLDSSTIIDRHGANNRASQNTRGEIMFGFIALGQKRNYEGIDWYKYIGVSFWSLDPSDPDHPETEDGNRRSRFLARDNWFRYSPHIAIGFKIGLQTVAATANPTNNHIFEGDYDQDFVLYAASTLLEVPGLSIDLHLGKSVEFGLGIFEGMSDGSRIVSGGALGSSAQTLAAWTVMDWDWISLRGAWQSVKAGGEEIREDPEIISYAKEFTHTMLNFTTKLTFWDDYSIYFGMQQASGDKANTPFADENLIFLSDTLELGVIPESRELKLSTTGFGAIAKFGAVTTAFDYTSVSTPAFNEAESVPAAVGLSSMFQSNVNIELDKTTLLYIFYHTISARQDEAREIIEFNARENKDTLDTLGDLPDINIDELGNGVVNAFESLEWTSTRSFGLGFKIRFSNNIL